MKKLALLLLAAMAVSGLPSAAQAQAQVAIAAKTVNVRAGPDRDYRVVAVLPAGHEILIQGCLADYSWCDVLAGPDRGWVYAGNIRYAYQNAFVPVLNYGAVGRIAVLAFVFEDYWSTHYHDRPWFGERQRRIHRPWPAPAVQLPVPAAPGVGPRPHPPAAIGPRSGQPQPGRSVAPGPQPSRGGDHPRR